MKNNLFNVGSVLIVFVFAMLAQDPVKAQQSWQKIAPVGESFSVLMPDKAKEVTRIVPLNAKDWIPGHFYSSVSGGKRYIVLSFVKTSPDRVLTLSSFDNFLSGMEQSFKHSEKEMSKSLTFDREVSTQKYAARQYHMKVGDYPGVARFVTTDKAFYGLMVIGAGESDAEVLRFLSSFMLTEVNTGSQSSGVILSISSGADGASASHTNGMADTLPPEPWPRTARPITGGVLNGKAISLPKPKYPKEAREAGDSGAVEVDVVIDEQGNVIKAQASSGAISLRDVCVTAALKARFSPTRLMGQPVKVSGKIVYNFVNQ